MMNAMTTEFSNTLRSLAVEAREIHAHERHITLRSVQIVGRLDRLRAPLVLGVSQEDFARSIGLTINMYWKRAQASRVMKMFPATAAMIDSGELDVSGVALLSPKLTQANQEVLLEAVRNKSKRAIEGILSRITLDGTWIDREAESEMRLLLTASQWAKVDRAREVLSHARKSKYPSSGHPGCDQTQSHVLTHTVS